MRDAVAGDDEIDQLSDGNPDTTPAIVPELNLWYMVVLLKEIAAAMRNPTSTIRGRGVDGLGGKVTTFTVRIQ